MISDTQTVMLAIIDFTLAAMNLFAAYINRKKDHKILPIFNLLVAILCACTGIIILN